MRNTQAISVTIPVELAKKLSGMQDAKKKNYSSIVTEALDQYVLKEEITAIRKRMSEAAMKAGVFTEEGVVKAVHEVRKSAKKSKNHR